MERNCEMCGGVISSPDRRRKYCDECRKTRKKFFDAEALKKFREQARERRKLEKAMVQELIDENLNLHAEIANLKNRIARYERRYGYEI